MQTQKAGRKDKRVFGGQLPGKRRREKLISRRVHMLFAGLLGVGFVTIMAPSQVSGQAVRQLSALSGSDGFRLDGTAAFDYAGRSVSGAGDINGDGFADLIVGVSGEDSTGNFSGSTYVVLGKASGFSASSDLSSLSGRDGFRLEGASPGDYAGFSVSGAGDVNGDGFDDLMVGANYADPNGMNSGSSYVIFGKSSGWEATINFASLDGVNGFRLDGAATGDRSGSSVSGAGDVNGDGFADIVVGAYGADSFAGTSYVIFGKASGWGATVSLSSLDGTNGFRLNGTSGLDYTGVSVSGAGDINGDGFGDLIVGASGASNFYGGAGSSYVVFGKASGWTSSLNISSLDGTNGFRLDGAAAISQSGRSVSRAGDINGDGFADLIVGAFRAAPNGNFYSGSSYVLFGKASGFSAVQNLSSLDGTNGFALSGAANYDFSGFSVSGAGDVNGDGYSDVVVGAYGANPNGSNSGSSYVVYGKATGWGASQNLSSLDGINGFRLDGVATDDQSGKSVSGPGDINGDGFADVIVGARGADPNGSDSGSSYIIFGGNRARSRATFSGQTVPGNSPKTAVGDTGNSGVPSSRIWLDFNGGPESSMERATLTREAREDLRNLEPTVDGSRTVWDVHSNREGWTSCVITLQYTNAEIAGISGGEAGLAIFRAPTPVGPWKRLTDSTVDTAKNQVTASTDRLAFFTLAATSVPATMSHWEVE